MSDPIEFIDKMNQAIYGDDWTMEKARKALQDLCGIPDFMLGDIRSGQAVMRLNADGTVSRVAPADFYKSAPTPSE